MMSVLASNDHPEVGADLVRAGKKPEHFGRSGRGGDVVVLRRFAKQAVANTPAGEVCGVSGGMQAQSEGMGGFAGGHGGILRRAPWYCRNCETEISNFRKAGHGLE